MNRSIVGGLTFVVGLVWSGIARADGSAPGHEGMVPELVCTSAARPLEQGTGAVQCAVVWVRPAK